MKAILVNPFLRTITEVEMTDNYQEIYTQLSTDEITVGCFTTGWRCANDDILYVDDEGLFKKGWPLFDVGRGDGSLLAGKGLIQGDDGEGGAADVKSTVAEITELVRWTDWVT
tara:strand:+ start:3364 stop:3702 length:339 start_codon:yes stop_codon:yes gene_type:complete